MTDWKTLCSELLEAAEDMTVLNDDSDVRFDAVAKRVRAELAQPALPDEGELTDQELLEVLDRATANFPPNHHEAESMTGVSYALALEVRKARAVLAHWGRPATQSAEELIQSYQAGRRDAEADAQQAAEAAEDVPITGEVAELVAALRDPYIAPLLRERTRAADLLALQHPQPVPVSERLPGPEDCDGEVRCWWGDAGDDEFVPSWRLCERPDRPRFAHWLPAHALPLPTP